MMLLPSILLAGLATGVVGTCWYPEGNAATDWDYRPCGGQNTTFSQCCILNRNETCLPNGLCQIRDRYDYRSACENSDWENCPEICPQVSNTSWVQVKPCNSFEYCCNPKRENGDCCEDGTERFTLATPSGTTTSTPSATNTGGATSSTPQGSSGPAPSQDDDDGDDSGSNAGPIAGGVVGGVAGLGLIGVGVWLWRRRKNKGESTGTGELEAKRPAYYPRSGAAAAEVDGTGKPIEMDATGTTVESDSRETRPAVYHEMQG